MTKGDKFIERIIPAKYDKFIDYCYENIVNSEYLSSKVEDTEIDAESAEINKEKNQNLT